MTTLTLEPNTIIHKREFTTPATRRMEPSHARDTPDKEDSLHHQRERHPRRNSQRGGHQRGGHQRGGHQDHHALRLDMIAPHLNDTLPVGHLPAKLLTDLNLVG